YAFTRPYPDQNGLTVVNFSANDQTVTLNLAAANVLQFSGGIQPGASYYFNNLSANTRGQLAGSALDSVTIDLAPLGSAIYTVSTTPDSVTIANPIVSVKEVKPAR